MNPAVKAGLPCYAVVGDDPHLSEAAVGDLLKGLSETAADEFGPDDELDLILQAIATPSMFDDRRTIVVRGVDKLPADAQRKLIACLDSPPPDATLILVGAKMPSQMLTAARKTGHVIEVGKGKRTDLFVWVKKQASAKGLSIAGEAMNTLIDAVGDTRQVLAQAIEELSLARPPGSRLRPEDIREQFAGRADVKLFGFIDAVAQRRPAEALESLHHLLAQGESPGMLFWTLARHFRMLLTAAECSPGQAAKALGIQDWRAEKLVRQARGFGLEALVKAYQQLAQADLKMKASEEPEVLTLQRLVVSLGRLPA